MALPVSTVRSTLTLPTNDTEGLVAFFERHHILPRARGFPGCLGTDLWIPVGEGSSAEGTVVVTADWESADRYQAWVDEPWRGELTAELEQYLTTGEGQFPKAAVYRLDPRTAG